MLWMFYTSLLRACTLPSVAEKSNNPTTSVDFQNNTEPNQSTLCGAFHIALLGDIVYMGWREKKVVSYE